MSSKIAISLRVNGQERDALVRPWDTLLHVLRNVLDMTGTKRGCNQGVCGACSVMVDGKLVRSCLSIAANCDQSEITTIEGLGTGNALSAEQAAYLESGAVQCGFCVPGMVMAITALLRRDPKPDDDQIIEGLSGNICRCSGYMKAMQAVRDLSRGDAQ